jgi:hypothetical protein
MAFDFGKVFKSGSVAEQFVVWQVLAQLAEAILAPAWQTVANETWQLDPNLPVPPDVLARLVNRGLLPMADGINEASKTGTGEPQFRKLVTDAGHTPDLAAVISAYHRGLIPADSGDPAAPSLDTALRDAGIRADWVPVVRELALQLPTAADYLNAYLQGQISESDARAGWAVNGMRPDDFGWMFDANGTAPTPDMAGTMANRGIIPWTGDGPDSVSFHQAFLEGPWRNKWAGPMRQLMQYLPPPRTVVAMVRAGSIPDARAMDLFMAEGLSKEDAAAYLAEAHKTKSATAKELTEAQIVKLFTEHKIDQPHAVKLLEALHYSAENAALLLSLGNVVKADTHLTAAINRVHTLFITHKITRQAATQALGELRLPAAQQTELLALWTLEIGINVRQLTPAQLVSAWSNGILTQDEAQAELEALGYTPFDAWVLLSDKNKAPLPGKPARGPGPGTVL